MEKLLIAVLGHRNSGKSKTWNELFGRTVKTGIYEHTLYLKSKEYVKVFLVSGSAEERQKYVGELITVNEPRIVLCSMQYREDVRQTIDYFLNRDYQIYCQWINPGYRDQNPLPQLDDLGIFSYFQSINATVGIRNGKTDLESRVQHIREIIYGWATYKNLIHT